MTVALLSLRPETGFWKSWEGKQRETLGVLRTPGSPDFPPNTVIVQTSGRHHLDSNINFFPFRMFLFFT